MSEDNSDPHKEAQLRWLAGITLATALLNTALWWTGVFPLLTIGLWLWCRHIARQLGRAAPRHATFGFGIGVTSLVLFLAWMGLGLLSGPASPAEPPAAPPSTPQ